MFTEPFARCFNHGPQRVNEQLRRRQVRWRATEVEANELDENNDVITQNLLDGRVLEVGNFFGEVGAVGHVSHSTRRGRPA